MTYGNQCVREYNISTYFSNNCLSDKLTKEKTKNCLREIHIHYYYWRMDFNLK